MTTPETYTLSLHDALPISWARPMVATVRTRRDDRAKRRITSTSTTPPSTRPSATPIDRKSTRLNSSHLGISYAVFCLKKKKKKQKQMHDNYTGRTEKRVMR